MMPLSSATKYQKTNPRSLQGGSFGKTIIGISYKDSITVIVIMNGAGIPSRLVPGFLADRWFGCLNVEIAFCCLTGVTMFCWIPVSSYTSLLIFSTVYGFFGAGVQSLFAATLASLSPDASKTGVRLGMVFSFISIACLTGEPVAGAIIQASNGDYICAQIYAGCLILAGTLILVGSRIARTGWKIKFRIWFLLPLSRFLHWTANSLSRTVWYRALNLGKGLQFLPWLKYEYRHSHTSTLSEESTVVDHKFCYRWVIKIGSTENGELRRAGSTRQTRSPGGLHGFMRARLYTWARVVLYRHNNPHNKAHYRARALQTPCSLSQGGQVIPSRHSAETLA
jgi:hypothetical protein